MNNTTQTNQLEQQKSATTPRIRKATFAANPESSNEKKMKSSSNTHQYTTNKNHTTITNNTSTQKKHKQNNPYNTNNTINNKSHKPDKSKVTSYFAASPARSNERVKNSRAAQLKNNKSRTIRKGSSGEIKFNHKYRYDVNITLHATTMDTRLAELQQNIDELMSLIMNEDKSARLLPWKTSNQHRYPAITSSEDTTGSFADLYLSRSWLGHMETKHRLYMKLYIGHDKSYHNILPALDDWNSHSDRQFKYCMIQAEETTFIGWFLYSTLNIDAGALADAIFEEYNIEVGLRWMDIRMLNQNTKKTNKTKPVKALHVETEKSKARSTMETLMKCYGRSFKTTKNFPNGIRLRFCKNLDNAAYKLEKTKLINLRSRQKQLLAETNKATSEGILDLDVVLKEEITVNEDTMVTTTTITTLRDAIMAIKSKYVKDTPLYRSVDLAYNSEEYVFAYHQSMADEAKAMVDYLYPYLLHLYDSKALKKAFDAVHIKEMGSFKYNIVTDEVEDTIAELSYAMMEDDQITGNQKFMEFDLSAMSLEEDNNRPQASILGKMYSGQDSISTQHFAGQSRAPQPTSEKVLEITEDELQELQQAMLLHTQTKNKMSARKDTLHIANMDTSTMLQQIRARRNKETTKKGNRDNYGDISQSSDEENDEFQEAEGEDYQDTMEVQSQENEDEMMNGGEDTSEENESDRGGNIDDDNNSSHNMDDATYYNQISQSAVASNEPPPPQREGGRG
jgi:hypothetical protein